jgi:integrase
MARRRAGPEVTFSILYRDQHGTRQRLTLGRFGTLTLDQARKAAKAALAKASLGENPQAEKRAARHAQTVGELLDAYEAAMKAGTLITRRGTTKKESTVETDLSRLSCHVRPLVGDLPLPALDRAVVAKLRDDITAGKTAKRTVLGKRKVSNIRGGAGAATRTLRLLGAVCAFAIERGLMSENPVHGVKKATDRRRDHRLSPDDLARLGTALRSRDGRANAASTRLIRFIALTGWRLGEAAGLRVGEVDLNTALAILPDTKTGRSVRPVGAAALDVLREIKVEAGALYFPNETGDVQADGVTKAIQRLARGAGIHCEAGAHVLRHTFASVGADLGYSDTTIGAIIGHKGQNTTTSRYTHRSDPVLVAAADAIAAEVARQIDCAAMDGAAVQEIAA